MVNGGDVWLMMMMMMMMCVGRATQRSIILVNGVRPAGGVAAFCFSAPCDCVFWWVGTVYPWSCYVAR